MGERAEVTRAGSKASSEGGREGEASSPPEDASAVVSHGSHSLQPYWVCIRGC